MSIVVAAARRMVVVIAAILFVVTIPIAFPPVGVFVAPYLWCWADTLPFLHQMLVKIYVVIGAIGMVEWFIGAAAENLNLRGDCH